MTEAHKAGPSKKTRWRWLLVPAAILLLLSAAIAVPGFFAYRHDGPVTNHFDGRLFHNTPADRAIKKSLLEVSRWMLTREPGPWSERRDALFYHPPQSVEQDLRVTFVNHSTVLMQADGLNILTDPVWSDRLSPLPFSGPRRFRQAGIEFEDLPPIDVVLITHNHYDHMDIPTIRALAEDHDPLFAVPLGNARYLSRRGIERVTELDWWDTFAVGDTEIHAVPAQHWSRRGLYDTNRALWAGYVIMTGAGPVYFAGDTGMGPHFESIRARLGPPRLAMLPIGAYLPRWFMAPQHIDPTEAVTAHALLGAEQSMAIHFGTFRLGDDSQNQPITELVLALRAVDVPRQAFWIPGNGESRLYSATDERITRLAAR